jgi:hypothetical protein
MKIYIKQDVAIYFIKIVLGSRNFIIQVVLCVDRKIHSLEKVKIEKAKEKAREKDREKDRKKARKKERKKSREKAIEKAKE